MKRFSDLLLMSILCLGICMSHTYAAPYGESFAPASEGDHFLDGDASCNLPSCFENCPRIAFSIDYLYWDVNQTGLDCARGTVGTPLTANACCCETTCRTDTGFFKFQSRSGFRVGVSALLPCWDDISLNFIYTYFHPRVKRSFHIPRPCSNQEVMLQLTTDVINVGASPIGGCDGAILPDRRFQFDQQDSVVRSRVKLKYELFDLVLSKNWECGCWFLTPYIGARVLWVRESLRNNIAGTWFKPGPPPGPLPLFAAEMSSSDADPFMDGVAELGDPPIGTLISSAYGFAWKQKIPAAGLTLGVYARYSLCCEWSVTGHFGLSVLGGKVKYHNNYYPFTSLGSPTVQYRAHHAQIITGWDGSLGLSYDWDFCVCPIRIEAGYEIQDWFNIPERVRYFNKNITTDVASPLSTAQTSDGHGRLTVHGLFVRLGVSF